MQQAEALQTRNLPALAKIAEVGACRMPRHWWKRTAHAAYPNGMVTKVAARCRWCRAEFTVE